VALGTTLSKPPFSQTNTRWASPGGVASETGWLNVSPVNAFTSVSAVGGGEEGTLSPGEGIRMLSETVTVTVAGAEAPPIPETR
jgi:hypothetical protein